jgi:hypothetical protein
LVALDTTRNHQRKGAAGSDSFPPPDRSGASPPVGHSHFRSALVPRQPLGSRRWHPCCRQCLLKGCQRWFSARWPQARYCSRECQQAALRWRRWCAGQRYRVTPNGKQHRRGQHQRRRRRFPQRCGVPEPAPRAPDAEPASGLFEAQTPPETDPPLIIPAPNEGQRPREIPENFSVGPCSRPGCYVLFLPALPGLKQKFCSGLCRQALRRVRQREARLRERRRHGTRPLCHRRRGPPSASAFMSSHN